MPRLLAWLVYRFLQRHAKVSVAVPDLLEPFRWFDARFEAIDRHRARLLVVNIAGIVWCAPLIEFIGAWDEFCKGQL